jgi:hypothetical protein
MDIKSFAVKFKAVDQEIVLQQVGIQISLSRLYRADGSPEAGCHFCLQRNLIGPSGSPLRSRLITPFHFGETFAGLSFLALSAPRIKTPPASPTGQCL